MCGSPTRLVVSEGRFAMNERLVVVLLIGLLVGWGAGNVVRFSGLGLAGDLTVGLVGAFLVGGGEGIFVVGGRVAGASLADCVVGVPVTTVPGMFT